MTETDPQNLPPLPELLGLIGFPVYGLASPFLGLQLRTMHYGVEEESTEFVGMGLFYAQKYLGSPRVLAIESSVIPDNITSGDRHGVLQWSLTNLVALREAMNRLHGTGGLSALDDEAHDEQFERDLQEIEAQSWALLTEKSNFPLLVGMEVTQLVTGEILSRRLEGSSMLLCSSVGLDPAQFLDAMKQLIPLGDVPKAAQRHQEEFERITAV
ncbi:MAG: hypothetical protein R3335_02325 [Anaerolineales bacterium]|nr:hypothetical protein [Anaerolineales bacterium]